MRLRKIKYADEFIKSHNQIVFQNPQDFQGKWNQVFESNNPIMIEIGCGRGQFIMELAKNNPQINYIGIEKFDSVIIRGLEKYLEEPLPNVRFIQADASHIKDFFSEGELSGIYLNFSDPWPKKRQEKRRLTFTSFLKQYDFILKNNCHLIMKTDNFGLFDYSMMSFHQEKYFYIKDMSLDYHLTPGNIPTEFELKFVSQGKSIYYIDVLHRKDFVTDEENI